MRRYKPNIDDVANRTQNSCKSISAGKYRFEVLTKPLLLLNNLSEATNKPNGQISNE